MESDSNFSMTPKNLDFKPQKMKSEGVLEETYAEYSESEVAELFGLSDFVRQISAPVKINDKAMQPCNGAQPLKNDFVDNIPKYPESALMNNSLSKNSLMSRKDMKNPDPTHIPVQYTYLCIHCNFKSAHRVRLVSFFIHCGKGREA